MNAGDGLNLTIENLDAVLHTFTFPHFGVDVGLTPGVTTFVNVSTTLAGTWQFWCAPHSSGPDPESHTGMVGWFQLLGPPDTTPPTITHTPPPGPVPTGAPIEIRATVADDGDVQAVALNYTDVAGTTHNVTMSPQGGEYVASIPAQTSAGNFTYFLYARDAAGNEAVTPTFTLAVTGAGPPPPGPDYALAAVVAVVLIAFLAFAVLALRRKRA